MYSGLKKSHLQKILEFGNCLDAVKAEIMRFKFMHDRLFHGDGSSKFNSSINGGRKLVGDDGKKGQQKVIKVIR